MQFTKMHGIGNDYIYVNGIDEGMADPSELAVRISDRHRGAGGDGLVVLLPSKRADIRMRIWNADGSEAMMCGNAIRCVAKYCYERGLCRKESLTVETGAGLRLCVLDITDGIVRSVRVNMGEPILDPPEIPVNFDGNRVIQRPLLIDGKRWLVTCLSMGNPHAVVFVEDLEELDLAEIGPKFERHELFPERINTEFVRVQEGVLSMRVWERGAGETQGCGTGACAALVAAAISGHCGREAVVQLPGGELYIQWNTADDCVYMTGPAEFVYDGTWLE